MGTRGIRIALLTLSAILIVLGIGCTDQRSHQEILPKDINEAINLYNSQKNLMASLGDALMSTKDNIVSPHVISNGETVYYVNDLGLFNELNANDTVKALITSDCDYFSSQGNVEFGYASANSINTVEAVKLKGDTEISFSVKEDGIYAFYLKCTSSDPIIIESIEFEIEQGE